MSWATKEVKWLQSLLTFFDIVQPGPIPFHCDNQAAMHIANNQVFHERTKHIEVDCHHVRDAIQAGLIKPMFVRTTEQLADIFTKALGSVQFHYLLDKLGICDLHAPT
ncbi:Retrovirus-related Pol polyprotein from transposon RE2 [Cardamine amara subsp. amara]|uniref:Retrovirus-related Pol polyprotein from transposon RE2 n=1 Tax=Cardamine amara subsp. amara TaxID=228776 RepID=A0ABD1B8B8_CARAN